MKPHMLAVLIPCAILAACERAETPPPAENTAPVPPAAESAPQASATATATLAGASGSSVAGQLTFTPGTDGVTVAGELTGLPPSTEHGFHLHEKGDCSAPDATSAGAHLNPDMAPHGGPTSSPRHLGDIPNVQSDAAGKAVVNATIAGATLRDGGPHDITGKAVIVHAKADDYKTQPSGNSGDRIACGVVN
jgi:superoxide dismutase, Cu-Zn family